MDPVTLGLILAGGGSLLGSIFGNRANAANLRAAQGNRAQLWGAAQPYLSGGGPSDAERMLLDFLSGKGPSQPAEAMNTGQDALMQMLRADPTDQTSLFKSFEPIEQRSLDQSLADFWGGTTSLGQRFGSAAMRQEGLIREQAAQDAANRREQMAYQATEANKGRQLTAAGNLGQLGLGELGQMISGFGTLGQLANQRRSGDINILSLLAGLPIGAQQPNQLGGSLGDIGQLIAMLPFLQSMSGGTH